MRNKKNKSAQKNNFLKKDILALGGLFAAILFAFSGLQNTFYQQDEWLAVGGVFEQGIKYPFFGFNMLQVIFGDGRPMTRIFSYYFFSNFPFNFFLLSAYSVGFHFANSILVFFIAKKLLGNRTYAFISAVFFALNSVSHQSVTWFAASFGLQPASFLILISLYSFIKYVDEQKRYLAWISIISCIISLYFKESGIFLFLFLPIVPFILKSKISIKKYIVNFSPVFAFAFIFILYRLVLMISRTKDSLLAGTTLLNQGHMITPAMLVLRFIMYPLTSFSLLFINPPIPRTIAIWFIQKYYPFITVQGDLIAYTVVLDMLSVVVSLILLLLLFKFFWKKEGDRRSLLFGLTLIVTSMLPYIVVSKEYTYLEPRYYYLPVIGAAIIFGLFIKKIYESIKWIPFAQYMAALIVGFILFLHIGTMQNEIGIQKDLATIRLSYISQLKTILPTLTGNQNVFYVMGNEAYVFDGNYTPFQNGPGYTFMVLYFSSGKIPQGLLTSGYFFNFEQGYKEHNGKGFGFYTNFDKLKEDSKKFHFSPNAIHVLYYDSKNHRVADVSDKTRKLLFTSE